MEAVERAGVLLEALPYIRRFQGRTFVIKYGGHAMVAPALKDSFAQDICLLKYIGVNVVVVHGGGPQISAMLQQTNVSSRFVDGRRPHVVLLEIFTDTGSGTEIVRNPKTPGA